MTDLRKQIIGIIEDRFYTDVRGITRGQERAADAILALIAPAIREARVAALREAREIAVSRPAAYADGPSAYVEQMTYARVAAAIAALIDKETAP